MDETPRNLYGEVDVEAAYQAALAVPLADKVRKAILLIQEYEPKALELSPDGYYVAFSGGKDSIVMAKLFEMSGVKYQLWYNNVTIDPPELVRFIKDKYPQAKWNNIGTCLPFYMGKKPLGPPSRVGRWCCEVYKEQGGNGLFKAIGVRAEESPRRKGMWTIFKINTKTKSPTICPILYFTETDIWDFIKQNEMEYCSIYDEKTEDGKKKFTRLGCVGCPMGGAKTQKRDFERWPQYEKLWQIGFKMHMERWKGVPRKDGGDRFIERFETWEEMWHWWMTEGGRLDNEEKADCQLWLW